MKQCLVTSAGVMIKRWSQAFPDAVVAATLADVPETATAAWSTLWLDVSSRDDTRSASVIPDAVALGFPVVVMSSTPSETEAFQALNLGAAGYCHLHSAAQQLTEISLVVLNNGIWMPPELLQRFLNLSLRAAPDLAPREKNVDASALTARELAVAQQVAVGATNREISERLEITERTVKAHLTSVFEKLQVRDRVQLALVMNNVGISAAVR